MSRTATLSLIAIAMTAATGAVIGTLPANASMMQHLKRCNGLAYSEALSCCEAMVENQRPLWMMQANQHCSSPGVITCRTVSTRDANVVTHVSVTTKKICYIAERDTSEAGNKNGTNHDRQRGGKDGNGQQGGGKE